MLVVGHKLLRGKDEPYWLHVAGKTIFGRSIRYKKVLGCRDGFFFLRFGLDMLEKSAGSSKCLFGVSFERYKS